MPKIRFVDPEGAAHVIDASTDQSLMDVAVNGDIAGIDAECGGEMACGTCHVYVDEEWMDKLPTQSDDEQEAIDTLVVGEVRPQSRLSCQIRVTAELDGVLVEVPEP
jgi:2Fe-2S ferredoxin